MNRSGWLSFVAVAALGLVAGSCDAASQDQTGEKANASGGKSTEDMLAKDKAIAALDEFIKSQNIDKSKSGWKTSLKIPPKLEFDPDRKYFVDIETNKGPIRIQFMPDVAPMHVSSFLYLTRLGFYDGLKFHRVIQGFMAQGGDPLGSGMGGPGYKYAGEYDPKVRHDRPFLLSMANAGPGTDGSQFFITFKATPHLDGKHTIFGEVVEGQETVKALEKAGSASGPTSEKLEMTKVTIALE